MGARDFVEHLTRFVAVTPSGTDAIKYAAELPMTDFEGRDAGGTQRARCGARHIAHEDVRISADLGYPAVDPSETPSTRSKGSDIARRGNACRVLYAS
ncbi:hypothetical protein [Candidatus Palauibacter sp.]|uniref:hypothetical protein n=1 Tax=Candidatus Palauibacter sp. TaxID=3101350 RepID=UPI003B5224E1